MKVRVWNHAIKIPGPEVVSFQDQSLDHHLERLQTMAAWFLTSQAWLQQQTCRCNTMPYMSPNYSTTNKLMYYVCENVLRRHFSHCKASPARYSNVHVKNSTVIFFFIYNRCMYVYEQVDWFLVFILQNILYTLSNNGIYSVMANLFTRNQSKRFDKISIQHLLNRIYKYDYTIMTIMPAIEELIAVFCFRKHSST